MSLTPQERVALIAQYQKLHPPKPCGHCQSEPMDRDTAARVKLGIKGDVMFKILNASLQRRIPMVATDPSVYLFNIHGKRVLFDANSLCAVQVDDEALAQISALPGNLPTAEISPLPLKIGVTGLLGSTEKPKFACTVPMQPRRLVLNVTHACNLACKYCFVMNRLTPSTSAQSTLPTMPFSTAERAISLLGPKADIDICFFGGEPLIAWPLIQDVVAYVTELAKKRGVGKRFHVTTNGILLDDEKVRFLNENGFSLIVSLDGPEDVHNPMRPARNSSINSQRATMAAVRRIKGTNLARRTTLRSTYTGLGADLVKRLEYLDALVEEGCAGHVSVEPCSLNETACLRLPDGHPLSITPEHYDTLKQEYHAVAEWYVAQMRAGKRPTFHHLLMPLQRILYKQPAVSECGAACGYMAVDPSGNIYGCHREGKSLIGHLDTGVDEELRGKWKNNRLYSRPDCVACPIRYVCGGGCRLDSLERHGDIHRPDPNGCFFRRRICEEALWVLCELGPETLGTIIRNPREMMRQFPMRTIQRAAT